MLSQFFVLLFVLSGSSYDMIEQCHTEFNPEIDYEITPEIHFCMAVNDLELTETDVDKLGLELNWFNYTMQTAKELVDNFDLFQKYGIKDTLFIYPSVGTRDSFPPAMRVQVFFNYTVDGKNMTFDRPVHIGIHEAYVCHEDETNYRCEPDPEWINSFVMISNNTESILDTETEFYESPLMQFNSGVQFKDISCRGDLILIQKYNGLPACVVHETKLQLIERGWAKLA